MLFTSQRERRLWLWALAVVVAIYSTLGLAGQLATVLSSRSILDASFVAGFALALAAGLGMALRKKPGRYEIWALAGVVAAYAMVVVRMGIGPVERTHLFEYGLVAVLILEALLERQRNGGLVRAPAILTIVATALLGWLDEGIQAILPNRVYELRDAGFNALAGLMAVLASLLLARARRRDLFRRRRR